MEDPPPPKAPFVTLAIAIPLVIALLRYEGRVWVCAHDAPWLVWCSDAWSKHTSQHLLDPYSFTHFLHGFLFCAVLSLVGRGRIPYPWMLAGAVLLEGGWELLENSAFIIERYRANTASLEYAGDSILNSVGDLVCCASGLVVCYRLGWKRALALFVAIEVCLLLWIRDSLLLNMLMLVHPVPAIKAWQQG